MDHNDIRHISRKISRAVRENAKAQWMGKVEQLVVAALPAQAGKVDWDNLIYLHATGVTPEVAATKIITTLSR